MAVQQLKTQQNIPDFNLPEKYSSDLWDVLSWEENISIKRDYKCKWKARSSITDYKLDFTLVKNIILREELKYVFYYFYEIKGMTLTTFSEYYDRLKLLAKYVNTLNISSLLDITDISDYEKFVVKKGNKIIVSNGSEIRGMELVEETRKSRFVTFLTYVQEILEDYYTKDIPERQKLIWHYEKLPCKKGNNPSKVLNFKDILNKEFQKNAQDFCWFLLPNIVFGTIYKYLFSLKIFFNWICNNYPEIKHLNQLNRDLIENYFLYLRAESDYSSIAVNTFILNLKKFFEWGQLVKEENMPQNNLILVQDYNFKTIKSSKYLTDEEMKGIISIIPKLPNTYGKIVYMLIFTGVRISELLQLKVNALKIKSDGSYVLEIYQYKTEKYYSKPLDERPAKIILNEIQKNQERFGKENVEYVFVNSKNTPITLGTINKSIQKAIIENDIKGRDGELLHVTTHMFRATLSTKLMSAGKDPKLVAKLLGQSSLSSLSHYATVDLKAAKEQLAPRIAKDQILISNIWNTKDDKDEIPETAIPLCNGFCSKDIETGICKKATACLSCPMFIPSIQFINSYELQLQETEATIAVAKANGYTKLLENALETKKQLESILKKLKELEDKKNGKEH